MTEILARQPEKKLRSIGDPEVQRALGQRVPAAVIQAATRARLIDSQKGRDVRSGGSKISPDGVRIDADNWGNFAECMSDSPDALFVQGAEQNIAKQVCARCIVKDECLGEALDNQIPWGVWGGLTERERRALLRKQGR